MSNLRKFMLAPIATVAVILFLSTYHTFTNRLASTNFNKTATKSKSPPKFTKRKACKYHESVAGKPGIITDNGILPPSPNELTIKDITFTIKTGYKLAGRLDNILLTWCPQAQESVIFITDSISEPLKLRSNSPVVETLCSTGHSAEGLNCKMKVEFEEYMKRRTKWWCHMDDDNYVNTDVLLRLLSKYHPESDDVYIGRTSYGGPKTFTWRWRRVSAWFAHGGCGFCVSRALAMKMAEYMTGELLYMTSEWWISDDVAVGFIINYLLKTKLTVSSLFNSHDHPCELTHLTLEEIKQQATLSYGIATRVRITPDEMNSSWGFYPEYLDPSRFLTIHCILHPETDYCSYKVL